jgi:uncharacterized protein (TIGR03067 family)
MNYGFLALTLAALVCAECTLAAESDTPKTVKRDSVETDSASAAASGNNATATANRDAGAAPQAKQALFGGEPITSVPNELTSLAFDHDGVLWIGSRYSGVIAYKDGRFTLFDPYNTPMNQAGISSILVDATNTKWFVAWPRGAIYTFDNSIWKEMKTGETQIRSLREDNRGRIWCIVDDRLSYIENRAIREFTPQLSADDAKVWRYGHLSYDIDRHGVVWVVLQNSTVFRIDGEKGIRVFEPPMPESGPIHRISGGIASGPESDDVYLWDLGKITRSNLRPDSQIDRLENGHLTHVDAGLTGTFRPIRWFPGRKLALEDVFQHGVALGVIGKRFRQYGDGTPLATETVTDVAIERPGRVWFAGRFGGLQLLTGGEWTKFAPSAIARGRLAWQHKPIEELVRQEAIDVDIHKVLQNPRQYANKKIRFKGRVASSFEYAEMLDADGNRLGIWPEWERGLAQFRYDQQQQKPQEKAPAAKGRMYDRRQSEPAEYLGFLEWGGGFGHVGGWKTKFTIVEEYPAGATKEERAKIKQAYLKSLAVTTAPWPIPDMDETPAIRDTRQSLQGVWNVVRSHGCGWFYQVGGIPRFEFAGNEVVTKWGLQNFWGTFRVDPTREPARIDVTWNGEKFNPGIRYEPGIYRLKGDKLLIRLAYRNGERPTDFNVDKSESVSYVELVRDPHATLSIPDASDTAKDDPKVIGALRSAYASFESDNRGRVIRLEFPGVQLPQAPQQIDAYIAHLSKLPRLENLTIWLVQVTDAGLAGLEGCDHLTSLNISGEHGVTDAGLKHLESLVNLESLELHDVKVTDAGFESLANLKKLKLFSVSECQVTGAVLGRLRNCADVELIAIDGPQVTDKGLQNLARFSKLSQLFLINTKITDVSLAPLTALTKLRALNIGNAKITDAGIANLSALGEMEDLNLSGTEFGDSGAARLRGLTKLHSLNVNDTRLTGAGLRQFSGCKDLETLAINHDPITAADLTVMQSLSSLTRLEMEGIPIDDNAVKALQSLPKLRKVTLTIAPAERKFAQALADSRPTLAVVLRTGSKYEFLNAKQR